MAEQRDKMLWPALALVVTQVVHGAVPTADDHADSEGPLGLIVGAIFLALSVAAVVGLLQHRPYGRPLAARTGLAVALGFIAYHAVPWASWFTNPYLGKPTGAPAWTTVILCLMAGFWCAYEGRDALARRTGAPAVA